MIVISLLEGLDMEVIYDFDRLHEGQPDKYWAASESDGFRFGFNSAQTLNVIFSPHRAGQWFCRNLAARL